METGPIIRLMQSSEASPKFLRNRIRIQDSAMRMDEHQNSPATTTTTNRCTCCACNDVQLSVRVNAHCRVDAACSLWALPGLSTTLLRIQVSSLTTNIALQQYLICDLPFQSIYIFQFCFLTPRLRNDLTMDWKTKGLVELKFSNRSLNIFPTLILPIVRNSKRLHGSYEEIEISDMEMATSWSNFLNVSKISH